MTPGRIALMILCAGAGGGSGYVGGVEEGMTLRYGENGITEPWDRLRPSTSMRQKSTGVVKVQLVEYDEGVE